MTASHIEELIINHQSYLRALARKIHHRLPGHVDYEDLVAFGQVGLVQSAQRFDRSRGAIFPTFAYPRIRGAIFEGLKKMCMGNLGDTFSDDGLAGGQIGKGSTSCEAYNHDGQDQRDESDLRCYQVGSASQTLLSRVGTSGTPLNEVERREDIERLDEAMQGLTDELAFITRKIYFESWTMAGLAVQKGVHKSTISRLHGKALSSLSLALGCAFAA